ncbi:MAG: sigma factor-like helix-turn-helix DNA-binding protein [Actinomycetota bacterium]
MTVAAHDEGTGRSGGGQGGRGRGGGQPGGHGQGGGKRSGKRTDKQSGKQEPRKGKRGQSSEDETTKQLTGQLQRVLARLPETQRQVLELRMGLKDGHPHDLGDTARELGLSMSEARDIEKRAFEHIREAVPLQQLQRFLGS